MSQINNENERKGMGEVLEEEFSHMASKASIAFVFKIVFPVFVVFTIVLIWHFFTIANLKADMSNLKESAGNLKAIISKLQNKTLGVKTKFAKIPNNATSSKKPNVIQGSRIVFETEEEAFLLISYAMGVHSKASRNITGVSIVVNNSQKSLVRGGYSYEGGGTIGCISDCVVVRAQNGRNVIELKWFVENEGQTVRIGQPW